MYDQNQDLLPAEKILLTELSRGNNCKFPASTAEEGKRLPYVNKIRSSILKEIILHGLKKISVPNQGLTIHNATITGDLDLRGCNIAFPMEFRECVFLGNINLHRANIQDLILTGSSVHALNLNDVNCSGSIILSYGFRTLYPLWARGAKISGQLGCSGGEFCGSPAAIILEAANIKEAFFWRHIKNLRGIVDLTSAEVGTLVDDQESWPDKGLLRLDGFTYNHLGGNTYTNYFDRLSWLHRQHEPHLTYDFRPQPFEQLAHVLRASGREEEAKRISIEKLHHQRIANFQRRDPVIAELKNQCETASNPFHYFVYAAKLAEAKSKWYTHPLREILAYARLVVSFLFWVIAGYGYRPVWCLGWSIAFIIIGSIVFSNEYHDGNIFPRNNMAAEWTEALETDPNHPYDSFFQTVPGYPQFHPTAYAVDLFVPLFDLNQNTNWTVNSHSETATPPSILMFYWSYIVLGWTLTAIFAASLTGIIRR